MTSPDLARGLQEQGYDVLSCHAAGLSNQGIADEAQLAYATQAGRAILTFNTQDFLHLDAAWRAAGHQHAGMIIVARPVPLGHLIRCLRRHLDRTPPEVQAGAVLWLDTSPIT
jgi:hypothetical protein